MIFGKKKVRMSMTKWALGYMCEEVWTRHKEKHDDLDSLVKSILMYRSDTQ